MRSLALDCAVSTHSRAVLEDISKSDWISAEFIGPSINSVGRSVRSNAVRISVNGCNFEIGAVSIDIAPKWEVFVLHAEVPTQRNGVWSGAMLTHIERRAADEMFQAFLGRNHTMLLITRDYAVPPSHMDTYTRMSVEDALLIKDRSGQQAIVAVDEQNPGGVILSRIREDIERVLSDASLIRPV